MISQKSAEGYVMIPVVNVVRVCRKFAEENAELAERASKVISFVGSSTARVVVSNAVGVTSGLGKTWSF